MSNQSNMKKLWRDIKSIVNIKQKSIVLISQLYQNGEYIKDPKSIANVFSNFLWTLRKILIMISLTVELHQNVSWKIVSAIQYTLNQLLITKLYPLLSHWILENL